jgi:hypothetical protein
MISPQSQHKLHQDDVCPHNEGDNTKRDGINNGFLYKKHIVVIENLSIRKHSAVPLKQNALVLVHV